MGWVLFVTEGVLEVIVGLPTAVTISPFKNPGSFLTLAFDVGKKNII